MTSSEGEPLLNIKELADLTSLPVSWIYSHTATGALPHYKIGKYLRFRRTEIELWLASQHRGPDAQSTPVGHNDIRRIRSVS